MAHENGGVLKTVQNLKPLQYSNGQLNAYRRGYGGSILILVFVHVCYSVQITVTGRECPTLSIVLSCNKCFFNSHQMSFTCMIQIYHPCKSTTNIKIF
jgi:hypothetical protein